MFTKKVPRTSRGNINELPLVLLILFLIVALPLIDLVGLTVGAGTAFLLTQQAASRAASHQRFDTALSAMTAEAQGLLSSGFAAFSKMQPMGGNKQTGADLFIVATNYKTGAITIEQPNQPLATTQIDPASNLYECMVRTKYQMGPIISMQGVPYLGSVPGLGKPYEFETKASRAAEYPMGLNQVGDVAASTDGGALTIGTISIPWDAANNPAGSSWNFVQLYDIVLSYGLTPSDDDVVTVVGSNPAWTKTKFSGGTFFFDTRPDGYVTCDGNPAQLGPGGDPKNVLSNGLPLGALIGKFGLAGKPFLVGPSDFDVIGKGTLYLAVNDGNGPMNPPAPPPPNPAPPAGSPYYYNTGMFMVRIILAQ